MCPPLCSISLAIAGFLSLPLPRAHALFIYAPMRVGDMMIADADNCMFFARFAFVGCCYKWLYRGGLIYPRMLDIWNVVLADASDGSFFDWILMIRCGMSCVGDSKACYLCRHAFLIPGHFLRSVFEQGAFNLWPVETESGSVFIHFFCRC